MNVYNPIAYPLTFSENPQRERLEYSNQVLLPPEILQNAGMDWFANNQSNFPAFFNLKYNGVSVNVGVLEFTEIPDIIYIPWHIFSLLGLQEGERVKVEMITEEIISATEITLKPHSYKFVELSDPKDILEKIISKNYPIISLYDIIKINHEGIEYLISVTKLEPAPIVKMLNCDVNLIFEPALDYVSPSPSPPLPPPHQSPLLQPSPNSPSLFGSSIGHVDASENRIIFHGNQMTQVSQFQNEITKEMGFVPFSGKGNRLGVE
jgi:hypothetical protein